MKIYYDNEVDSLYLELDDKKPNGAVEVSEGVSLDTTPDGKISGIEILDASKKVDLKNLLNYSIDPDFMKNVS